MFNREDIGKYPTLTCTECEVQFSSYQTESITPRGLRLRGGQVSEFVICIKNLLQDCILVYWNN